MAEITQSIFREYDIRGIAEKELSAEKAYLIGRAIGKYLTEAGEDNVIVGKDMRTTSDEYEEQVVRALTESGLNVVKIGMVSSPICYYAGKKLESGFVMITASHNPKEYNGFKIGTKSAALSGDQIQKLYEYIQNEDFVSGEGNVEEYDIVTPYKEMLQQKISIKKPLKVVIDCGNGATSPFVEEIFKNWGCDIVLDYCTADGNFPNHIADPVKVSNGKLLAKRVLEEGADIGIGFDGDGDRLGVVDEKGNMIFGDTMMVLFYEEVLKKYPEMTCLIEVKCSQALYEMTEKMGGKPEFSRTGHSLIKARMKETDAKFAGEMSGHMFFADEFFGHDDGIYAAGRLLRIIADSGKTFSELLEKIPSYISTPEVRVMTTDEEKFEIVDQMKQFLQEKYEIVDVDGVRVLFQNGGWGLVRASNTQPAIVVRAEAKTDEELELIKAILEEKLLEFDSIKKIDWSGKEG